MLFRSPFPHVRALSYQLKCWSLRSIRGGNHNLETVVCLLDFILSASKETRDRESAYQQPAQVALLVNVVYRDVIEWREQEHCKNKDSRDGTQQVPQELRIGAQQPPQRTRNLAGSNYCVTKLSLFRRIMQRAAAIPMQMQLQEPEMLSLESTWTAVWFLL